MSTAPTPPGTFVAPGAAQETGKKRASRIPLDYFKKATSLDWWKWRASGVAAIAVVVYCLYNVFSSSGEDSYSRGPVTHHHANLECSACHDGLVNNVKGVFDSKGTRKVNETKCVACHAGPDHHPGMKESLVVGCGACHQEHRGAEASLVRLPDSTCTSCHASLSASMTGQKATGSRVYADVKDFASHPSFQMPEKDPGNIKFNHALHMTPGQVKSPDDIGKVTFEALATTKGADAATVQRYKEMQEKQGLGPTGPKDLVKLTCASCHQLDAGDMGFKAGERNYLGKPTEVTEAALQPRGQGTYFQPIVYEIACQACHPLTFDPKLKDDKGTLVSAPHRMQPPALKRFVEGAYLRELVKPGPSEIFAESERPTRPVPGKLPPGEGEKMQKTAETKAAGTLTIMLRSRAVCGECHSYKEEKGQPVEVLPANIPQVWQPHARFSHTGHRAMDCRACHPNADAKLMDGKENPKASIVNTDINLPDIANCRECHTAQKKTVDGIHLGGVRSDCTGCHSYHHGTMPLLGPGSAVYDPIKAKKDP